MQALQDPLLLARAVSSDEYGVVARNRADHFGPARAIHGHGDALRGADRRLDDGKRGSGGVNLAHEAGEGVETAVDLCLDLRQQHVSIAGLDHAELAQVAADARLRGLVTQLVQEPHQVRLTADDLLAQDLDERCAPLDLLFGFGVHKSSRIVHKYARTVKLYFAPAFTERKPLRMTTVLDAVEIETGPAPEASVIWLHGLGADGHDFEPVIPELVGPRERALRFVFPHSPVRPVTINNGYQMRAWYDIAGIDRHSVEDEAGIRGSDAAVRALIARENERGVPANRIVLAGFSQGGAMALFTGLRYPEKLAGLMGLSCYVLLASTLEAERHAANQSTPIFMAHGLLDPVIDVSLGEGSRKFLESKGYSIEWHTYPMPHSVCAEEIAAIAAWLRRVLPGS